MFNRIMASSEDKKQSYKWRVLSLDLKTEKLSAERNAIDLSLNTAVEERSKRTCMKDDA